jgi:hemerythrin
MTIAPWRDDYCTGHATIDSQHRHLFDLVNRIHDVLSTDSSPKERALPLLQEFAHCAQAHFELEEQLMTAYDYPHQAMHCKVHQRLVNKVLGLLEPSVAPTLTPETVTQVMADWIIHHIKGEDQRMIRHFRAKGVLETQPLLV